MRRAGLGGYPLYAAMVLALGVAVGAAVSSVSSRGPGRGPGSLLVVKWERIRGLWGGARRLQGIGAQPSERGDLLYAFFNDGLVYRSTDGGQRWEQVTEDARLRHFGDFAAAGREYGTLILSCPGYGNGENEVFRSEDNGRTWVRCDLGQPRPEWASALAADLTKPEVVYLGARGAVYKSTDGGHTWKKHSEGLRPDASIGEIAVHPSKASVVYAGGDGFYRSDDGGLTWDTREEGLPEYTPTRFRPPGQEEVKPRPPAVSRIILDQADPESVQLRVWPGGRLPDWYSTSDGGRNWRHLETLWPRFVRDGSALVLSPSDVVGAARSAARATNWLPTGVMNGLEAPVVARVGPARSHVLVRAGGTRYPRTNDILGRSTDEGVTWKPTMTGVDAGALDVRVISSNPEAVVATTNMAIWSSLDGGKTWQAMGFESQPEKLDVWVFTALNNMQFHPTDPNVCYATSWEGLYRSDSRGRTWHLLWRPATRQTLSSLQICRAQPTRIYMNQFMAATLRSNDGGHTWSETAGMLCSSEIVEDVDLVAHPVRPDIVYARKGWRRSDRLYKSTDAADSWVEIGAELQTDSESLRMLAPIIHPKDPRRIYALAKSWKQGRLCRWELLVSADEGETWHRRPCTEEKEEDVNVEALRYQSRLALVPDRPGALLAIAAQMLFYSPDDGRTWQKIRCPEQSKGLNAVTVSSDGTIWLATEAGLYRGRLPRSQRYRSHSQESGLSTMSAHQR